MKSVFIETSALLRYLLKEDGNKSVHQALKSADRIVASRLIKVEAQRALIQIKLDRPEFHKVIPQLERALETLWPKMDFVEITREICDLAERISPSSRLRSLDAIHLATYQRVLRNEPKLQMLSFDQRILAEIA